MGMGFNMKIQRIKETGMAVTCMWKKKPLHDGVILGCDPHFTDVILVGVLWTTVPGVAIKPGRKYISVFHTRMNRLVPKTMGPCDCTGCAEPIQKTDDVRMHYGDPLGVTMDGGDGGAYGYCDACSKTILAMGGK